MNHDHLVPRIVKIDGESRAGGCNAAAELEDDAGHVVYCAFSRT
jgi:hypothetical protein